MVAHLARVSAITYLAKAVAKGGPSWSSSNRIHRSDAHRKDHPESITRARLYQVEDYSLLYR